MCPTEGRSSRRSDVSKTIPPVMRPSTFLVCLVGLPLVLAVIPPSSGGSDGRKMAEGCVMRDEERRDSWDQVRLAGTPGTSRKGLFSAPRGAFPTPFISSYTGGCGGTHWRSFSSSSFELHPSVVLPPRDNEGDLRRRGGAGQRHARPSHKGVEIITGLG